MIKEKMLKNKTALILAVFLSFLMIWPQLYFTISLGEEFKGVVPPFNDDELFYSARIQEVLDGYPTIGNAYLFEHKDSLSLQFLGEYLLAQPLKIFGLSVVRGRFLYNLLLPSLSFLLAYLAFYRIIKSRFWAVIFSSFLFFGLYLNNFLRPVSPQLNFVFWLSQFIFLWELIKNGPLRKILVLNAVNLGLLFYIYPYYWTFYLVFLTILVGVYFIYSRELTFAIMKILAGGLILAIPYFVNSYFISRTLEYEETITRLGLIYSRFPSGARVILGAFVLLVLFMLALRSKLIKIDNPTLFFSGGIFAAAISMNQHLITGRNLEFSSHYRMLSIFFFIFSFAYLWKTYLGRNFSHKKLVSSVLVLAALFIVAQNTYAYLNKYSTGVSSEDQKYALLFDWLNKNTPKDSVVYADNILSNLIPIYTNNNVFYSDNANLFLMADDEVLTRFILNNFFESFDEEFVIKNVRFIYRVRYADIYGHAVQSNKLRRLLGMNTVPEMYLPKDIIDSVLKYADELKNSDFKKELGKYRVDYILWDKNKNPEWLFKNHKFVSKVFENDGFVIYSVDLKI